MIVPTVDTIRYEYLIRHLLLQKHEVLLVGAVGTGKSTVAESVLTKLNTTTYEHLLIHMSAQVNIVTLLLIDSNDDRIIVDKFEDSSRYLRKQSGKTCKESLRSTQW